MDIINILLDSPQELFALALTLVEQDVWRGGHYTVVSTQIQTQSFNPLVNH